MTNLADIADGVWGAETTASIGLGAHLPLRMTVLRDGDGLVLVSPIAIDEALAETIDALGPVQTIIAPNLWHHMYAEAAKRRYPDAKLLGAPGLAEKCPSIPFDGVIDSGALSDQIEAHRIAGAEKLSEVVLLHRPSRTLVVTDAVFHILEAKGMTRFVLKFFSGALGRLDQSRLIRFVTGNRVATEKSVAQILEWPFERVVMAHGEVVTGDAVARLRDAWWWWRQADKPAR